VLDGIVVADAGDDCDEAFPAASNARTVYEYGVPAANPVSAKLVVVDVPACTCPRKMR
jgi:hypothetical protein